MSGKGGLRCGEKNYVKNVAYDLVGNCACQIKCITQLDGVKFGLPQKCDEMWTAAAFASADAI